MTGLVLPRRRFLLGLSALIAAPAIVRATSLMPVKVVEENGAKSMICFPSVNGLLTLSQITREAVILFKNTNMFLQRVDKIYGNQWELN